jgi:hypothetical protein
MQEAKVHAVPLHDHGLTGLDVVHACASMQNADLIQPPERRADRRCAVVDVVRVSHGVHTGEGKRLGRLQRGVEAFVFKRVFTVWLEKAAFQVGKHHVGRMQPVPDARKWCGRVGDAEEIDITG